MNLCTPIQGNSLWKYKKHSPLHCIYGFVLPNRACGTKIPRQTSVAVFCKAENRLRSNSESGRSNRSRWDLLWSVHPWHCSDENERADYDDWCRRRIQSRREFCAGPRIARSCDRWSTHHLEQNVWRKRKENSEFRSWDLDKERDHVGRTVGIT